MSTRADFGVVVPPKEGLPESVTEHLLRKLLMENNPLESEP
jgi:hypothetical protein